MRTPLLAVLLVALSPLTATAAERTVSWYAEHPEVRARILTLCEDDPGRLERSPDCINARRAEIRATADAIQAQRGKATMPQPRPGSLPPSWFQSRPAFRATVVGNCRRMDEAQRARYRNCESAERSYMEAARR